jgi:hypothetical protein
MDVIEEVSERLRSVMDDPPFEDNRQLLELLDVRVEVLPDGGASNATATASGS